jgi:hypothetical protein
MASVLQDLGSVTRFAEANMVPLIAASMFGFVFLTVLALTQIVQRRQSVRRRAIAFNPAYAGPGAASLAPDGTRIGDGDASSELLYLVERGLPRGDRRVSRLRQELIQAGFFQKDAIFYYYVIRLALALVLVVLTLTLLHRFAPHRRRWNDAGRDRDCLGDGAPDPEPSVEPLSAKHAPAVP